MKKRAIILPTIVAVLVTGGVAAAISGGSSGTTNPAAPQAGPADPTATFGALRRAKSDSDQAPDQAFAGQPVDAAQARQLDVATDVGKAWVAGGSDYTCITGQLPAGGGGSSCTRNTDILDGLAVTLSGGAHGAPGIPADENIVFGLVPDGSTRVAIVARDGSSQPVDSQSFAIRANGAPAALEFVDSVGKLHRRPLAYCEAGC